MSRAHIVRLWDRLASGERLTGGLRFALALLLLVEGVELHDGAVVFIGPTRRARYWSLFANPRLYEVERAIELSPIDTWVTRGRGLGAGDRGLIWRGLGVDGRRGVVTLFEVLGPPFRGPVAHPELWHANESETQELVMVRYVMSPPLPLWLGEPGDDVLRRLPVSRARGGTVFRLTEELWEQVLAALGGWPDEPVEADVVQRVLRSGRGQGFQLDQATKDAVERLAMERADDWLRAGGWEVEDVHARKPYDLVGRRDGEEIRVEVKGTVTSGERVLLTPNEVDHARTHPTVLFVLREVEVARDGDGRVQVAGGIADVYDPFTIDDFALRPLHYSYGVTHLHADDRLCPGVAGAA